MLSADLIFCGPSISMAFVIHQAPIRFLFMTRTYGDAFLGPGALLIFPAGVACFLAPACRINTVAFIVTFQCFPWLAARYILGIFLGNTLRIQVECIAGLAHGMAG